MRHRLLAWCVLALGMVIVLSGFFGTVAAATPNGNATGQQTTDYVLVRFSDAPVADYLGGIAGYLATKPGNGHKLDLTSGAAIKYQAYLNSEHANYRSWLKTNVPGAEILAEYTVTFNGLALLLHGASANGLMKGPRAAEVTPDWLYRPSMDVSVPLINAPAVWSDLGVDLSGTTPDYANLAAIKVGVIDSGIIPGHPFIDDCREANPVVHKGPYFSGMPFGTLYVNPHGTHVAGTIGGCKVTGPVNVDGTMIDLAAAIPDKATGYLSGVAPGVTLYDYNVFPGMGVGYYQLGGSAFSHDIMRAVEQAVIDGMDVINLSIGGGVQGPHDLLAEAIDSAVDAGVVAAIAAGNSGPGTMTVESPGTAAGAITAGAISNPHYLGITVTLDDAAFGGLAGTTIGAALGAFANFDPALTAPLSLTSPANGCGAITTDLTGEIAVIDRGLCTFGEKIQNAQDMGAIGVLVVNSQAGDPTSMGADGVNFPAIPAAMVSITDGAILKAHDGAQITVDGTVIKEIVTNGQDILASFSGWGPTPYTFLIKPDVTTPGVNVLSSVWVQNTDGTYDFEYSFYQGTSMATPHVAGSAALLLAAHPDWTPADVKSALVNTADRPVGASGSGLPDVNPNHVGGGRVNLGSATNTPATLYPSSVSFGVWTGGGPRVASADVSFTNPGARALTCGLSFTHATADPGISLSVSSLAIPVGGTATVTVNLNGGFRVGTGFFYGDVVATCGGVTLRAPWFVGVERMNGGLNGNMHSGLSEPLAADLPEFTGTTWVS